MKSDVKNVARTLPAASPRAKKAPAHLAATDHEKTVTEFEQALICAAESFYRFAGALLGPEAREHNLSGQDCVILQQLIVTGSPRRIGDLLRFANRDDVSNVQYSLRKLIKAGLVKQIRGARHRDMTYAATPLGARVSARLVSQRRDLLMKPTKDIADLDRQMRALTLSLGLLTGVYDHGTRVLVGRNPADDT